MTASAGAGADLNRPGRRWLSGAAFRPGELDRLWARRPGASARLPAGRAFDVLDLSETDLRPLAVALGHAGHPVGPVFRDRDRARWLVAPSDPRWLVTVLAEVGWPGEVGAPVVVGFGQHVSVPGCPLSVSLVRRWVFPPWADPQPLAGLADVLGVVARLRRSGPGA